MGRVGLVDCQGFLAKGACFCVLVGKSLSLLFSLKCSEVSSSEFWGVCGFGMVLGILSFNAQGCVPALLEN